MRGHHANRRDRDREHRVPAAPTRAVMTRRAPHARQRWLRVSVSSHFWMRRHVFMYHAAKETNNRARDAAL
jgi:hypothetical protein